MKSLIRTICTVAVAVVIAATAFAGKDAKKEERPAPSSIRPAASVLGQVVILQEGFNDTSLTSPWPPAGWSMINNDGSVSTIETDPSDTCWYQSLSIGGSLTGPPFEGVGMAAAYYGTANGTLLDDWLITPNVGLAAQAGSVDSLTFWMVSRLSSSGSYPDSLDIRVSSTNKAVGSFTRVVYLNVPKTGWTRVALAIPQSATRYIAFRYLMYDGGSTGSNSDKVSVDDVRLIRHTTTAVGEEGKGLPTAFALRQNYPNPFNPSTRLEFSLPVASHVMLTVYDALGRAVATVANEELSAGVHVRDFDASGLAGGVYFARFSAGSFTATRHMLLVK
jgi:hypothetical protein